LPYAVISVPCRLRSNAFPAPTTEIGRARVKMFLRFNEINSDDKFDIH